MNKKQVKKKEKSKKRKKKTKELNLEDVLHFGGEKEEYDDLLGLDENAELEIDAVEGEDTALKNEIQSLIKDMGLKRGENKENKTNLEIDESVSNDVARKKKKMKVHVDKKKNTEVEIKTNPPEFRSLEFKKHDQMFLRDCLPWYELTKGVPKSSAALYKNEIDVLFEVAEKYWKRESELYQEKRENDRSSDAQWLRTVLKSGTLSDRVAALTMLTQESPVHSTKSIDALMNMAKKKSRREALIAVDSLRHLWVADLLPDYKLRKFSEFPIENLNVFTKRGSKEEKIKFLITMVFEDHLKKVYRDYIDILQNFSKDPLSDIRNKVISIVYELLSMKPEEEQSLLSILVNKLGDLERKVASKTSFLLCQLVTKHPNMKSIVIGEVERMMYRPNICEKAQYYAICFLNQIVLSHKEKNTASKLIAIYFSFFKSVVHKQGKNKTKNKSREVINSQQSKLLSGLLTGVNRAFPYVEGGVDEEYDEQLNTLFRLTHLKHLGTSVQAIMLIYQVMESKQSISDRYYQALYEKLLDPDVNISSKHTMLLNILFKSLKNDHAFKRVKSFIKRLLQVSAQNQPSFLCGLLFLISEVIKSKPGIKGMTQQPEDRDEEEHFVDAELDDDQGGIDDVKQSISDEENNISDTGNDTENAKPAWTFVNQSDKSDKYIINHRNPLYAGADNSCLWEVIPLLSHFHPSVEHFANSILDGEQIDYKGDPSQDFTLISFLDRFMYRNPKKKEVEHGHSLMQRRDKALRFKEEPVNSKLFLQKSEENIPQDKLFFYRYFKEKLNDKRVNQTDEIVYSDGEIGDVDDIDFAGEIKRNKVTSKGKKKKKDVENGSDSESDEEEDYDYDKIDDESFDEDDIKTENFNDQDYEKALFENLDSEGESIDNDSDTGKEIGDIDPMFAAADEFSHILEGGADQSNGVHHKQLQWEESNERRDWKIKKSRNKVNTKRKGKHALNKNAKRKKVVK